MELTEIPPPMRPTDSVVRTRVMFALKRAGIPLSIPAHAIFMTEEGIRNLAAAAQKAGGYPDSGVQGFAMSAAMLDELIDALRTAGFAVERV